MKNVIEGQSIRGTEKVLGVPVVTKKRSRGNRMKDNDIFYEPDYRQSKVFSDEEEADLAKCIRKG